MPKPMQGMGAMQSQPDDLEGMPGASPMPAASPMALGDEYPEEAGEGDTAEQGYSCEGKFPLTDPMWTQDVKQGQP